MCTNFVTYRFYNNTINSFYSSIGNHLLAHSSNSLTRNTYLTQPYYFSAMGFHILCVLKFVFVYS